MLFQSLENYSDVPLHGTYCLNIHPGEAWTDVERAVRVHARAVRQRVAPDQPFGLGLRLGAQAVHDLSLDASLWKTFRAFCAEEQLYVFTFNGFPYGSFHGTRVKEQVYSPDWTTDERSGYTCQLATLLADMLPEGLDGSISTVPCSFKPWLCEPAQKVRVAEQLATCVAHLMQLEKETGREIHIGLEPEPACTIETTDDFLSFYKEYVLTSGATHLRHVAGVDATTAEHCLRRHLGVCLDTCHAALQYESPAGALEQYRRAGIRISKLQISAALEMDNKADARIALKDFDEPVYLHQVRAQTPEGKLVSWTDLDEGLNGLADLGDECTVRVHFHVPLFWEGSDVLRSTAHTLDESFWRLVREGICSHIEVETYTYDVLPPALRSDTIEESIARELQWCRDRISAH